MTSVRELWQGIQSLSEDDRNRLFARLMDWPEFQRCLEARRQPDGRVGQSIVVFDGGSRGNPGPGYGSYSLRLDGGPRQVTHLEFHRDMTNNEAEYEALIQALTDLRGRLLDMGRDPGQLNVTVIGDTQLVINQVTGAWKAREARMLLRRDRVRNLLVGFGQVKFERRRREEIVEELGH